MAITPGPQSGGDGPKTRPGIKSRKLLDVAQTSPPFRAERRSD